MGPFLWYLVSAAVVGFVFGIVLSFWHPTRNVSLVAHLVTYLLAASLLETLFFSNMNVWNWMAALPAMLLFTYAGSYLAKNVREWQRDWDSGLK